MIDRLRANFVLWRGRTKTYRRRFLRFFRRCPDCGGRTARAWTFLGNEGRLCVGQPRLHAFVAKERIAPLGPGVVVEVVSGFHRPEGAPDPYGEPDHVELL